MPEKKNKPFVVLLGNSVYVCDKVKVKKINSAK